MNIINKYINQALNKVVSKVNTAVSSMDISGEQVNLSLTKTIDDFRNKLNAGGGPAEVNNFMVSFELPTFMNDSKMLGYLGVTQFNEELGILCYKASGPEKKFNTVKVKDMSRLFSRCPNLCSINIYKDLLIHLCVLYLQKIERSQESGGSER